MFFFKVKFLKIVSFELFFSQGPRPMAEGHGPLAHGQRPSTLVPQQHLVFGLGGYPPPAAAVGLWAGGSSEILNNDI